MRRLLLSILMLSIPALMMLQVLQAYNYIVAGEEIAGLDKAQMEQLDENNRLLAAIAVFDSPRRIFNVATQELGLKTADPENMVQVRFSGEGGDQ